MSWLALAAVLLMSLMPTVSRVLAVAGNAASGMPTLVEMCTSGGLRWVDISSMVADARTGQDDRNAGDHDSGNHDGGIGDACGYCTLGTPLPLLLLLFCLLAYCPPPPLLRRHYRSLPRALRNMRGLGAQAPPLTL
ncbi:DUF2946 family protein [Marilutibacter maris]|uniref:DUF2946 family protein n=1 Tax=Marilutibacter maris TaxID=1605891 RepID=UPI000DAA902F|nr:DUF2946 family protein [Lysobacter maris]